MSPLRFFLGLGRRTAAVIQKKLVLSQRVPKTLGRGDWSRSLRMPRAFYLDCFRYFHQCLPRELQDHRNYFSRSSRGFGEDAMHVGWFLLFREFKPGTFLEIGVYRGQVISLISLLSKMSDRECSVQGISPFSAAADSVSEYLLSIDYYQDTLTNFAHFCLPKPSLLKALSTDPEASLAIKSRQWDMVYIDGNHDYEVVRLDWEVCSRSVRKGGVIVLDDSSLNTDYRPPLFATRGHPGPSRVASEIDADSFREILRVGHNRAFQKI